MADLPNERELHEAISAATEDEIRTIEGAIAARYPCELHCSQCEGDDHHWMEDCDDAGEPLMICKHCVAWRTMTKADLDAMDGLTP